VLTAKEVLHGNPHRSARPVVFTLSSLLANFVQPAKTQSLSSLAGCSISQTMQQGENMSKRQSLDVAKTAFRSSDNASAWKCFHLPPVKGNV